MMYTQCTLKRKNATTVSWIPSKFAKNGKFLKLMNDSGEWVDGWEVISCGSQSDDPLDAYNAIKAHRKATGDSLPK